jgi:hypothetical protein
MADERLVDVSGIGDSWRRYSKDVSKGNVDVYPQQFRLKCGNIEILADGPTSKDVKILIDGKVARGVYDLHVHFNTKRLPQLTLGVFLGLFDFDLMPKEAVRNKDQGR